MTYYVKTCPKCSAKNHPAETNCLRCMTPLPKNKTESKNEPLTRPKPPIVKRPAPSFVEPSSPQPSSVIVTDINMRFGSMVWFMVKWVIATIPALIILAAFAALMLAFIAQFGHTPKL